MKKLIAIVLALACVLSLVSCGDKDLTFDIGEASKINIKSGLTGDEVNIADNEFIESITENINSLRFEKTSAADGKVGYVYMLTWFDIEDKQIASITVTDENGYQISHDGYYYKAGDDRSIDIELIAEMFSIALSSSPEVKPMEQLTLDKVIELSAKGEALTWSDFEQYRYEDVGSGLYIYRYDIDSNYELRIGGVPSVEPMYILLVSKENPDNSIDIRTDDMQSFLEPTEALVQAEEMQNMKDIKPSE